MLDTVIAIFFIEFDDCLGVASRGVAVATTFQIGADRRVIIDLAVEDDPNGSILVRHRLMSTAQVDNTEAPETEGNGTIQVVPGVVRSAVEELPSHDFNVLP